MVGERLLNICILTDFSGERGEKAERMMGGWSDMSSPESPA